MYTDNDLNSAVEKGIFSKEAVTEFRNHIESINHSPAVDEENIRLVSSFNDIFVVIACFLLLFSASSVLKLFSDLLAVAAFPILSWGLAEFFVLKRKMALPAIILLLSFIGGVFALCIEIFGTESNISYMASSSIVVIAAYLHYKRFQIPITIAAGTAAITGFLISLILSIFPSLTDMTMPIIFLFGIASFFFAMYWDALDRTRETRHSDIAFWLHLLSAPLIVHPVFQYLGILEGVDSLNNMAIVILLYFFMTFISIIIDRRAFMVSSLVYVLYAISNILEKHGVVGHSFAITGVCIGAALLLLSAYWHPIRKKLVPLLPLSLQKYVPKLN